jgi:cytochrome c heme-lyase
MSNTSDEEDSLSSGCPWLNKRNNPIINPRNMMPEIPQTPATNQTKNLSTERAVSSIPKTGAPAGQTWEYPSPQQFYNALLRRNKTAQEDTMDSVVHVHNAVNEDSWKQVVEWESMHQCREPSLQRFVGKSEEPSIKARLRKAFGLLNGEELFDRHDWFVDRCGTKTVRYIIDYYDTSGTPGIDDPSGFNVRIDTRPAPDSIGAVWDRIRKPFIDIANRQ